MGKRRSVLFWVLASVLAGAIVVLIVWALPSLLTQHPRIPGSADRHKAIADARTGLVALFVAIGAAGGLAFTATTYRLGVENHRLNREEQVTDMYTRAVAQLGDDQAPVRLGALYSLERLGQNNPPMRQTIVDVLCAYLRMPYTPRDETRGVRHRRLGPQRPQARLTPTRKSGSGRRPRSCRSARQPSAASPTTSVIPRVSLAPTPRASSPPPGKHSGRASSSTSQALPSSTSP